MKKVWILPAFLIILTGCEGTIADKPETDAEKITARGSNSPLIGTKQKEGEMDIADSPQAPVTFNDTEKQYLLGLARSALSGEKVPPHPGSRLVSEPLGAFVTLKKNGDLRGCIGYIIPQGPLEKEIPNLARAAAYEDPRFMPVTPEEVPSLSIDISVMTKLWQMKDPEEIVVGTHGLLIMLGRSSGVLLPQVATEFKVDKYQFLDMVCRKAGLPPKAWKDTQAKVYLFAASVFGE